MSIFGETIYPIQSGSLIVERDELSFGGTSDSDKTWFQNMSNLTTGIQPLDFIATGIKNVFIKIGRGFHIYKQEPSKDEAHLAEVR